MTATTAKHISPSTVEDALRNASRAAFLVVGAYPSLGLPPDYAARRQLFHSLPDTSRRALLLQLLTEEGGRLHNDAEASFTQRVTRRSGVLDRGDATTDPRRPKLSGDTDPSPEESV
jgi:hypothetical protein